MNSETYLSGSETSDDMNFVKASLDDVNDKLISKLNADSKAILMIETNKHGMAEQRRLFMKLINKDCKIPSSSLVPTKFK